MLVKLFAGLTVIAGLAVAGITGTSRSNCCVPGAGCCDPPQQCCAGCCENCPCCDPTTCPCPDCPCGGNN